MRGTRVEHHPLGGIGVIEEMTGLPIGMKMVRCDYAPKPADFAGAEFLPVAISFYKNNCVGCPHRLLVGLPNLATVSHETDEQEKAQAERHAARNSRRGQSVRPGIGRVSSG